MDIENNRKTFGFGITIDQFKRIRLLNIDEKKLLIQRMKQALAENLEQIKLN